MGLQKVTDVALGESGGAVGAVCREDFTVSEEVAGVPEGGTSLTEDSKTPEVVALPQESECLAFWMVDAESITLIHAVHTSSHLNDVLIYYLTLAGNGAGTGRRPRNTVGTQLRQVGCRGEEGAGEGEELGRFG